MNRTGKLLLATAALCSATALALRLSQMRPLPSTPQLAPSQRGKAQAAARVTARVTARRAKFWVLNCTAQVGSSSTIVIEDRDFVRYITPYFTAYATVRCTTPAGERYTVGFIQQVDSIDLKMQYPRAYSSWEMPQLPINDSGGQSFPWIDTGAQSQAVAPESTGTDVQVTTNDNFDATVSLREPLPPDGQCEGARPELQGIKRSQRFTVWLAARRTSDGQIALLKKITWRLDVDIAVDCTRPFGARARANPVPAYRPLVTDAASLNSGEKIPPQALRAPTANQAQQFWWSPRRPRIGARTRLR